MAGAASWPSFPVILSLEDEGGARRFEYSGEGPVALGRDRGCDVVLPDKTTSLRHACIVHEDGKLLLKDTESRNGTFLNGERISIAELHAGDVLKIGVARIVIAGPSSPAIPVESAATVAGPQDGAAAASIARVEATGGAITGADAPAAPTRARPGRRAAKDRAATGARRGKVLASRVTALLSAVVLFVVVAVAFALLRSSMTSAPPSGIAAPSRPADSVPQGTDVAPVAITEPPAQPAAAAVPASDAPATPAAVVRTPREALSEILQDAGKGALGWDVVARLQELVDAHPDDETRAEAERLIVVLAGTRKGAEKAARGDAAHAVDKLVGLGRHGEAAAAARFLAGASGGEDSRAFWQKKSSEIEAAAQARFHALEEELNGLIAGGNAADALRALASARKEFSSFQFYETLLDSRIEAALSPASRAEESLASPAALQLKDQATLAFDGCEYLKLAVITQSLLALSPAREERLRLLESLVDAYQFQSLLGDFLAYVAKGPVEVESLDGYAGRIVHADSKEYEYELDVSGTKAAVKRKQLWSRLTTAGKLALFEGVPAPAMSRDGFLGLAALAFRTGDEEGGQRALLRLHKRGDSQDLVSAVLARHLGIELPSSGFIEFEGKLVTVAARDAELERRRKAADEEKIARVELQRAQKDVRVGSFIEQAKKLRQQGSITVSQALLAEVAKKFPGSAPGKEARRMLDDPILAVRTLLQNGPSKNRLDFYFLADGYPAEDAYQAAFLVSANTAMKLVLAEEPYKEYASYLNFFAVELASRDRGLVRLPGGAAKDTAVGGKITYDVFTADGSKAKAILRRAGKGNGDGQAIVIGNDFAGVSTGGGGVSSVCKASLSALPHEVGHALGGLRDEYDFEPGNDPNRKGIGKREPNVAVSPMPPNLMGGSDREDVLKNVIWKNWVDAGTDRWWNGSKVSVFEGGDHRPFNVWRPQSSCKMRDSTGFCVVCMEVMVKAIYRRVRPIDRADPEEKEITLPSSGEREVRIWPMKPEKHLLDVKWYLQQLPDEEQPRGPTVVVEKHNEELYKTFGRRVEPDGRVIEYAVLRATDLKKGRRFKLRVDVHDPTPWVLKDDDGLLHESREWLVKIQGK